MSMGTLWRGTQAKTRATEAMTSVKLQAYNKSNTFSLLAHLIVLIAQFLYQASPH